ncbi:MAG: hypothetical protein LBN27_11385 [Prevotellaceae bacterium]|jgi:hypothetical protein|nr:hypothetical protein [Prevotellaceae bacterium]
MNLKKYLFLFLFAFTSITFFSCKKKSDCRCSEIKEVEFRKSPDEVEIIRLSNVSDSVADNENGGIYDVAPNGAYTVAYYDDNCNTLPEEPATGIFCVEYSNGKMVKILK